MKNITKGWITSLVGVLSMVITLIMIWKGNMDFVWDGVAGLTIGTTLLLAPKTVEQAFTNFISKFSGNAQVKQQNIPEDPKPE